MRVVAGKSFKVTMHSQPLMTFYSCACSLFHYKSPGDLVCFSITLATYQRVLCEVGSRARQAPRVIILVNKRQLLNSTKALDETSMTIGIGNQRCNHVLLEICAPGVDRNTLCRLWSPFSCQHQMVLSGSAAQVWSVNANYPLRVKRRVPGLSFSANIFAKYTTSHIECQIY